MMRILQSRRKHPQTSAEHQTNTQVSLHHLSKITKSVALAAVSMVMILGITPAAYAASAPGFPVVTIDSATPNPTNGGVALTWHANESGQWYSVRVGGSNCLNGTQIATGNYITDPAPVVTSIPAGNLSEGTNTIRVCVMDTTFLTSATTTTVTKDTSRPVVTTFTATTPTSTLNIPVTSYTATDTGTGVAGYLITESSTAPVAADPNWSAVKPTTYSVASSGTYTLYPWAKDAAGNVSLAFGTPRTVYVDATAPTVTLDEVTPNPTNDATVVEWYADENGSYSVRVGGTNCTDGTVVESGAYNSQPSVMATSVLPAHLVEGSNTVFACVTDALGNVGSASGTITYDTVVPVVTINSVNPTPTNGGVDVTWQATENGTYSVLVGGTSCADGVEVATGSYLAAPAGITTTIDSAYLAKGVNTVRVCLADSATNVGHDNSVAVKDITAPVITLLGDNPITTPINHPYYDPGAIASDNLDSDWFVFGDESSLNLFETGFYSVMYDTTDTAGNAAEQVTRAVLVDDMDGVDMGIENAAPNSGDANNDGVQDKNQPSVASLVNPVNGKYVVLEVGGGYEIHEVSMDTEAANGTQDAGYEYPAGMMHFTIACSPQTDNEEEWQQCDSEATITQIYYGVTGTFVARKYNPATQTYETIDGATITQDVIDGQTVTILTYTVADGGNLDMDGEQNGVIVDPVGLAAVAQQPVVTPPVTVTPAAITTVKAPNTGFAPTKSDGSIVPAIAVISIALLLCAATSRRRTQLSE